MMKNVLQNSKIDNLDKSILKILTENAMTPYTEIGKKLMVSSGTIHVRMDKLQKMGVVKGATVLINYSMLGYDLTCFVGLYLKSGSDEKVIKGLQKIPEVVEAHFTTGEYGMFLKLVCMNTQHLRNVINDNLQMIEGVERTVTLLSLEENIQRSITLI